MAVSHGRGRAIRAWPFPVQVDGRKTSSLPRLRTVVVRLQLTSIAGLRQYCLLTSLKKSSTSEHGDVPV